MYSNMTRIRWFELDGSDNNTGRRCRRGVLCESGFGPGCATRDESLGGSDGRRRRRFRPTPLRSSCSMSLLLRSHAVVLVSRFDARAGLVTLRQRFVRRCQKHARNNWPAGE